MTANDLIKAKKELKRLQNKLGEEINKGKFKDINTIKELKYSIRDKKVEIGKITRTMITHM